MSEHLEEVLEVYERGPVKLWKSEGLVMLTLFNGEEPVAEIALDPEDALLIGDAMKEVASNAVQYVSTSDS